MEDKIQGKKPLWKWYIRIFTWIFAATIAFLLVIILLVNIPTVQTFIVKKITRSIQQKTGTETSIGRVSISIPRTVHINDIIIRDQHSDTLLYLQELDADFSLFGLLRNKISISSLHLKNLVGHVSRTKQSNTFNFQFFIDAFKSKNRNPKKGTPWVISLKEIALKNIHVTFVDEKSGLDAAVFLGDFEASVKDFDIGNKIIRLKNISLDNTIAHAALALKNIKKVHSLDIPKSQNAKFDIAKSFLKWQISAERLNIKKTHLRFDNNSYQKVTQHIDYNHLMLSDLLTEIYNINISPDGYKADIRNISFRESSGFIMKRFSVDAKLNGHEAEVKTLIVETAKSYFLADAKMSYPSSADFISDTWNCMLKLNISNSSCNTDEVLSFVPALANNKIISKFKNSDVSISTKASGKISDLMVEDLEVSILQKTYLKTRGRLTGLMTSANPEFNASIEKFSTNQHDVFMFADREKLGGLKFPESVSVKGSISAKNNAYRGDLQFTTAYGFISADAFYKLSNNIQPDSFNIIFRARDLLAGVILNDTMLGKITVSGTANGSGLTSAPLSGQVIIDVEDLLYNRYNFKNIMVDGRVYDSVITLSSRSGDSNFSFKMLADADLKGPVKNYSTFLDISNLNLNALNITERNISISTKLSGSLNNGINNSDAILDFSNTRLSSNGESFPIKKCNINAVSINDSVKIQINSDLADGKISGNLNIENLGRNLKSAFRKYFGLPDTNMFEVNKNLAFKMDMHIPNGFISLFVPDLDTLVISKLEGNYNSSSNKLSAEIRVPKAIYHNNQLDSLSISINGLNEKLNMDIAIGRISYNKLFISDIRIKEQIDKGIIQSEIKITDSLNKPRYLLANEVDIGKNYFRIRFLPDGLVLDGNAWNVNEGNYFDKQKNKISTHDFVFTKDTQSIGFFADEENQNIIFKKFGIQNLTNLVEYNVPGMVLQGNLSGEVAFSLADKHDFIDANLNIDHLMLYDTIPTNLKLNIKSENDKVDIDSRFENDQNKILIKGTVDQLSKTPELNLKALFDLNNLSRLEKFTFGYLSQMSGNVDGEISVKGTTSKPEVNGILDFKETAFKINSLNFLAKIKDEKLHIDNKGAHFTDFVIEDIQGKKLTINGDILNKNFKKFAYNLHLVTDNFQPINSTVADNPLFYGKLSLNTDVMLTGDIKSPKIEANTKINPATNLTYALPGSELKLVTSEGIVQFLEPTQSFDSLFANKKGDYLTDSIISLLKGYDLILNFEVDPGAVFTIDIDPKSGDSLTLCGNAKLNFTSDRTGKQSITGIYVVKKGSYQLSFYGLVKKNFTIKPDSRVTWSGRPMDAELNITAEYIVRTSSVNLVANETSNMSDAEKNIFNQRLPYEIQLKIRGFLAKPEISFNIVLPDKYQVSYPLIASKLAILNTEEMVSELNKQVFSLLVTGGFMADNPMASTGSSTTPSSVATTAARNSVNGILADQMNRASDRYVGIVDLNFGLTTYENYDVGETETRTELDVQVSKKLMNDRLNVEAQGSFDVSSDKNTTTATSTEKVTGEFSVTYSLTETGEYKLRVFYQNAYDFFDGQISYSGIAFIFEKEFETLKRQKKQMTEKDKNNNKAHDQVKPAKEK